MTKTCCVPGCKSGYASQKVSAEAPAKVPAEASAEDSAQPSTSAQASVITGPLKTSFHRFPTDENLKRLWIQKIPRQN